MAFTLARAAIDKEIARIDRGLEEARANRQAAQERAAELKAVVDALQAEKDDLQAAKLALSQALRSSP